MSTLNNPGYGRKGWIVEPQTRQNEIYDHAKVNAS